MNILPEALQNSVSKLTQETIKEGFQQEALHEYKDSQGKPLYWRIRLKNHATGEKWIRPLKWTEDKGYSLGEPAFE